MSDEAVRAEEAVDRAIGASWSPPPRLSVSQWADRYRRLSSSSASEGRWRTSITPYLREVMDAMGPASPWRRIVLQKGAQLGGSAAILNLIGYVIHHAPGPILVVHPTVEAAELWSKEELTSLIELSPEVRSRVSPRKSRDSDNTNLRKKFAGGYLLARGANSPAGLRRVAIRYVILDDVDGFPLSAGEEGDPVELAQKRASTWGDRAKIVLVSTPTTLGESRIEQAYRESDQRIYEVPCPHCGDYQALEWTREDATKGLVWPQGAPLEARYECAACHALIEDWRKTQMLAAGRWRPRAVGDGRTAGFLLPALYAPHGWVSWGDLAQEWTRTHRDPVQLRAFVNTRLAQTWDDKGGESVDGTRLLARCEDWGEEVPEGVGMITAGVDVQGDRLEVVVLGWGLGEECWSLEHRQIWGDPTHDRVWSDLDEVLLRPRPRQGGGTVGVGASAIDASYATAAVAAYCRARVARRVWAVRGGEGVRPLWPRRPQKSDKYGVALYRVGIDAAKRAIYGRLAVSEPGPGYLHLHRAHCDTTYLAQLTAERMRLRSRLGHARYEWVLPDGVRNEVLDCHVYAYAALHGLYALGRSIARELEHLQGARTRAADAAAGATGAARATGPEITPASVAGPAAQTPRAWVGRPRPWSRR